MLKSIIATSVALLVTAAASKAQGNPEVHSTRIELEVSANIESTFRAWRSARHGNVPIRPAWNAADKPLFRPLLIEMTGGNDDIEATLVESLVLRSGKASIRMYVTVADTLEQLTTTVPVAVARRDELQGVIKTLELAAVDWTKQRHPPGIYTGTLTVLFSARQDHI